MANLGRVFEVQYTNLWQVKAFYFKFLQDVYFSCLNCANMQDFAVIISQFELQLFGVR